MHVSAGQVIYRQGDQSDSFYIVSTSFLGGVTASSRSFFSR